MSKHPEPWKVCPSGNVYDANGALVLGMMTSDPEARSVLLHAAEMFALIHGIANHTCGSGVVASCCELDAKIEAEIAKASRS